MSDDAPANPTCFYIGPIGAMDSSVRRRSDNVLRHVIEEAAPSGITVVRADMISRDGGITQQIIEYLAQSEIVICDLTGANANVMYELGIRHALDKPTLLICEQGESVPFDLSGERVIFVDTKDLASVARCKCEIRERISSYLSGMVKIHSPVGRAGIVGDLRASGVNEILSEIHKNSEAAAEFAEFFDVMHDAPDLDPIEAELKILNQQSLDNFKYMAALLSSLRAEVIDIKERMAEQTPKLPDPV